MFIINLLSLNRDTANMIKVTDVTFEGQGAECPELQIPDQ